jgi:phosphatidylglycerophosphate synthase
MNGWLLPIARRVPLSPNAVTVIACILNLTAAFLFAFAARDLLLYPLAMFVVAFAGLLDALDGAIARAQNKTSRYGDFLDHFLDRVSDSALLIGWAWGAGVRPILIVIALAGVLLVGYLGTQIEATFGQRSYEGTGRAEFLLGLIVFAITGLLARVLQWDVRLFGLNIPELLIVLLLVSVFLTLTQRLRLARQLAGESDPR